MLPPMMHLKRGFVNRMRNTVKQRRSPCQQDQMNSAAREVTLRIDASARGRIYRMTTPPHRPVGDAHGIPANEFFDTGRPIVAVLQAHNTGRNSSALCDINKVGVGGYDRVPAAPCVLPSGFIGCVPCAEQRVVREGSSPSGARMRGAISKSGDNTSLAGEGGRYGEA